MTIVRKIQRCENCGTIQRGRSLPDLRRFFSVLHAAFHNWPELAPWQPQNEEALRAYLLVKAGHYDVEFAPYEACETPADQKLFRLAIERAFTAMDRRGGYSEIRVTASGVEILRAKSIAFANLTQAQWTPIRESVEAVIEQTIGVSADELLRARAA